MRSCLLIVLGLVFLWMPSTHAEQPNIVVILADDMGYGDVRFLNTESKIPTPNLDALAHSGLAMLDAHSPSAVCTPTRYGLLTGRYCWRSKLKRGVLGGYSKPLIEEGRETIADMLKSQGYRTGAVGKWHLGMELPMLNEDSDVSQWDGDPGVDYAGTIANGPLQHGFDSYFGVSASLDMAPYVYIRNDGFTMKPTLQQKAIAFPHFIRKGPRSEDFIVDEVLDRLKDEAVAFIERGADGDDPYFLYMPLTGPHKPTQPHERFRGKTGLKEYGDFVHQVDWTVGEVLNAIERTGESEDTLVIFTSDNGSYMHRYDESGRKDHVDDVRIQGFRPENHRANGPLRGTKADVWEAGHRVPCFVRWPAEIPAGQKSISVVCLTDIYATLADIVGVELASDQAEDSISLYSALASDTSEGEQARLARGVPVINHSAAGMFAIRQGKWKLVAGNGSGGRQQPKGRPFQGPFQLYDLSVDLAETNDLAEDHPDKVEELMQRLETLRNQNRSVER
ncbi:MAG: arylsulfatase [Planctomycetota bacterium]